MNSSIRRRLEKLEARACASKQRPYRGFTLPNDTRAATDRRIIEAEAEAEANGCEAIIFEFVPAADESINEFRQSQGMAPLDVPGWDDVRGA